MKKAKRVQATLNRDNSVKCGLTLPGEVMKYIAEKQLEDGEKKPAGKGRVNLPTKADWCYTLLQEGHKLFLQGEVDCNLSPLSSIGARAIRLQIEKKFRDELEQAKPSFPVKFRGVVNFAPHLILAAVKARKEAGR